jgi:hypothetical protein
MYDKSLRQLPSKVSLKLTRLQADYIKAEQNKTIGWSSVSPEPGLEELHAGAAEKMLEKVEDGRYKKKQLEEKLREITEKHEQDKIWVRVLADKLEKLSPAEAKEPDGRNLYLMQQKILPRLKKAGEEMIRVELEIELLKAGAGVYEAQHKRLTKGK